MTRKNHERAAGPCGEDYLHAGRANHGACLLEAVGSVEGNTEGLLQEEEEHERVGADEHLLSSGETMEIVLIS